MLSTPGSPVVVAGVIAALVAALTPGCTTRRAQLVVVVQSDLPASDRRCIHVEAAPLDGSVASAVTYRSSFDVGTGDPPLELPFSFGVLPPGDDATRRVLLRVSATRVCPSGDAPVAAVVTRTIRTGFIRGQRIRLSVFLANACVGVSCGVDEDCDLGECVPSAIEPETLSPIEPGRELEDAAQPDRDAAPTDAGPPPDAASATCRPLAPTDWFTGSATTAMAFSVYDMAGEAGLVGAVSDSVGTYAYFQRPGAAPVTMGVASQNGAIDVIAQADGSIFAIDQDLFGDVRANFWEESGANGGVGFGLGSIPARALARVGPDIWVSWLDTSGGMFLAYTPALPFTQPTLGPLLPGSSEVSIATAGAGVAVAYVIDSGGVASCALAHVMADGRVTGPTLVPGFSACHAPAVVELEDGAGTLALVFSGEGVTGGPSISLGTYDASLAPLGPTRRLGDDGAISVPGRHIALEAVASGGLVVAFVSTAGMIELLHVDRDGDAATFGGLVGSAGDTLEDYATLRAGHHGDEIHVAWRHPGGARRAVVCDPWIGQDLPTP